MSRSRSGACQTSDDVLVIADVVALSSWAMRRQATATPRRLRAQQVIQVRRDPGMCNAVAIAVCEERG